MQLSWLANLARSPFVLFPLLVLGLFLYPRWFLQHPPVARLLLEHGPGVLQTYTAPSFLFDSGSAATNAHTSSLRSFARKDSHISAAIQHLVGADDSECRGRFVAHIELNDQRGEAIAGELPTELAAVFAGDSAQAGSGLVVDVGAGSGYHAVLAGKLGCRVLAIEPMPAPLALLRHSIALNALNASVRLRQAGIASTRGKLARCVYAAPGAALLDRFLRNNS